MLSDHSEESLLAFHESVRQSLLPTRYRLVADDIAQERVLAMLNKRREGQTVPNWPGTLPPEEMKRVFQMARKAKKMSENFCQLSEYMVHQKIPGRPSGPLGADASNKLKKLEAVFGKQRLKKLIERSAANGLSQKVLAQTVGMPYRTFKYKVNKVKSLTL